MACSESDYAYLREVVLHQSANRIDASRNTLFDNRLSSVAHMAGVSSLKDLVEILRTNHPPNLHRAVAEAMTVNETSFFRDVRPFDLVRTTIFPNLIERRRSERRLRIWSAACSTGQEAYSLAMLLVDRFPEIASWDVQIIGSDISTQVVDYARRGRYRRLEVNRGLPAGLLLRYFQRHGEEWEISPEIRRLCSFRCLNLNAMLPSLPVFDLVLLRNVLLYFQQDDRSLVFSSVYRQIAQDGYLLLGNAEQAEESTQLFQIEFSRNESSYFYRPVSHPAS